MTVSAEKAHWQRLTPEQHARWLTHVVDNEESEWMREQLEANWGGAIHLGTARRLAYEASMRANA